ncbi:MAG: putative molybdenum carrier protein [Rhodothermia bacterium]|nr:putative molybdenum carrier protein [Rhodothermia bacterium]
MPISKIISGGQTGVDRAALDVAIATGLESGGWCPAGRRAEDGSIPERYQLEETPTSDYGQRTEWNVRDAGATLILAGREPLTGGTELTLRLAESYSRPVIVSNVFDDDAEEVRGRLSRLGVSVLNVAGPRESEVPGIYRAAKAYLLELIGTVSG